ncbi:LacI family DNA-binding transcriptional regulator [Nocardia acidivorans]|uniref:LacI family DNA-binding transcriptional regulator n=1 Tax=Nocardia acidivorans TaxID=404580 RepID=UPI00082C4E2B|nr:LacI family DNA-binding transcriptional regulator [Nocardia acidivorans]
MAASRPTIRDVAAAAGVSVATVSHALNGKGRIDARTRERIQRIAVDLGYQANPRARALRTGAGNTLGIVASLMSDESADRDSRMDWYMRTAVAAAAESLARGYALTLVPPSDQRNWVQTLAVDGVLLVDPDPADGLVTALVERGMPTVIISGDAENDEVATVSLDRASAVACAMTHFRARGHSRPALVIDSGKRQTAAGTHHAFVDWCALHAITPRVAVADASAAREEAGRAATLELLQRFPDTDCVYAPLDAIARGVARALAESGRADISLITAEGMIARLSHPPLTAIDTKREAQAVEATRLLIDLIRTGIRPASTVFTADLIVRD